MIYAISTSPSNDGGFTLIEVIVALMIFAVVSVLAAQGLRTLIRSHQIVLAQSDKLEKLQIALALMNRNISQTLDRPIINQQNVIRPALFGGSSYVEFTHGGYVNPQGIELRSTLQRTAYFLDTQGDLVQRNWPVLDRTAKTLPTDRILIKHIAGLKFRYMDTKNQYFDTWPQQDSSKELPRAIEMTMGLARWGELGRVFIIQGKSLSAN